MSSVSSSSGIRFANDVFIPEVPDEKSVYINLSPLGSPSESTECDESDTSSSVGGYGTAYSSPLINGGGSGMCYTAGGGCTGATIPYLAGLLCGCTTLGLCSLRVV